MSTVPGPDADLGEAAAGTVFDAVPDARPDDVVWPAMSWPPPPDTVLAGRVVEVTPVDLGRDIEELFHALDDDEVWEHLPFRVSDPEAHADFLRGRVASGWMPWTVRLRVAHAGLPAGTVVGTSSYLDVSVGDARLEIGATAYRRDVWATAVNPETKLLLLGLAFDELHAGRVQLKTDVRNTRSQRAIARLGARYEGTLGRYQRRADGTVRDTALFAVLAEDWPRVRDGLRDRLFGLEGRGEPD
jgi:RimJ/RimL family protein N-acetyltransferase